MKNKIIFVIGMLVIVLFLIYVVSLTNTNQTPTESVKSKQDSQAYINKDKPTAIYIEGNQKPVLTIEDLPKEFPPDVHHMEGATPRDGGRFYLASLSPDGQRIAFSCGGGHEWVGVFELSSKKLHFEGWFFDTHVDQILWSPNSKYLAFTIGAPISEYYVIYIVGFKEKSGEPHITNSWDSGMDNIVSVSNIRWIKDGESMQFEVQRYEIKNNEIVKMESESVQTITLKAVKEKEESVKEPPKKVKTTN